MAFVTRVTPRLAALVAGLALIGAATVARAETADHAESEYGPVHIEVQGGPGNPLGAFGVALAIDLTPWLSVDVGGGAGRSALQYGTMVRARKALADFGVSAGAGISRGDYRSDNRDDNGDGSVIEWVNAAWFNAELGADFELRDRARFRVFGGLGFMFNSQGCALTETQGGGNAVSKLDCNASDQVLPYVGVGLRI